MPFSTTSDVWSLKSLYVAIAGDNWPVLSFPDPNFNQVSLLLNGDGPDGGQNNTYTDSSSNGHTITPAGTIEQGSVSPFGDNWSNYLDGTVEHLQLPVNSTLSFGAADFTIEGWMNVASIDGTYRCFYSVGPTVQIYARNGTIECYFNNTDNTSGYIVVNLQGPASSITANTWHYFTVVRNGTTFTAYVDGVAGTPITGVTAAVGTSARGAVVGNIQNSGGTFQYPFTGYISNLRIVKGTALYTSAFTPPTEPLTAIAGTSLLTCQSNYFVDNSTNALTITVSGTPEVTSFSPFASSAPITLAANGGSVFVNGAGDRLKTTESLGSGDFTVEFWAYTLNTQDDAFFDTRTVDRNPTGLTLTALTASSINLYDSATRLTITGVSYLNQWVHFVVERSSGTITIYVNGTSGGSVANTTNYSDTNFSVGDSPNYGDTDAYISNFRLVKGSAVYGGNFTPPTAPLTAITNTALLLNFKDAAIFDYAALNNLGTIGNADISTAVVKYGTGSLAFDGTGDWLQIDESSIFAFGTGDFTIEMWVYNTTNSPTYAVLWDTRDSEPDDSSHIVLNLGKPSWWYNGAARIQPATAPAINTWYHLAVTRSGTSTKMFIDGTQVGSTYSDSNDYKANDYARIGSASDNPSGLNYFNGYIDDFRITKGLARYTANFTPPEAALPTF